jgi:hypothetical protein
VRCGFNRHRIGRGHCKTSHFARPKYGYDMTTAITAILHHTQETGFQQPEVAVSLAILQEDVIPLHTGLFDPFGRCVGFIGPNAPTASL